MLKQVIQAVGSVVDRRLLVFLAGFLTCIYAIAVLFYALNIPTLGLATVLSTDLKSAPKHFLPADPLSPLPREGDRVVAVGGLPIGSWADLLLAPFKLQDLLAPALRDKSVEAPVWAKITRDSEGDEIRVTVRFKRAGTEEVITGWCILGNLSLQEMTPSIIWFFLEVMLFAVGALVFWNRPKDDAAAQFFLLCSLTLGAYLGGYQWTHIITQPFMLVMFIICAVLLPVVSLHFYLVFPRKKRLFERHPRWTLAAIYGPPFLFLAAFIWQYLQVRSLYREGGEVAAIQAGLDSIRNTAYIYLGVASVWYLACVASLVHSFFSVSDITERNQVKWILFGALVAILPIGYSLYLALWEPDAFGAGAATWPMFAASVCLTAAFAVAITRYRLLELDQIITSGLGYFLVSFIAGLVYFVVVFIGTLIFHQSISSPDVSKALVVSTTALLLMLGLDLARGRIKKALDRRFHRDKSQLDRTLQQMGKAIEQLVDPPALAQRLLQASTEYLGVSRGAVYLRQGEPALYRLTGHVGNPPALGELSSGCPLIEALHKGAVVSARTRPAHPPTPAQRQLQFMGGEIAHALTHEDRLLALLVLGPKDHAPYRPEDLGLLSAFAQITVLALESADGHRTIEVLNKDLQGKVEKISEQQRRILALQSQLRRQTIPDGLADADQPEPQPGDNAEALSPGGIVGCGPAIRQLLTMIRKVAATEAVVLLRGESGTGKELLARAVHETSARVSKPFVKVHCAALSASLLESELFGHVKGAFTGAHKDKIGRFELASGGSLFLDEIGDVSLEVQTKLLRVLQERTFERVGSSEPVFVDVRIIAATHQDLERLIEQGRFREDLFYRLNVFPVFVPPLRQRKEDIAELAMHFVRVSAQRCRKEVLQIDDDVLSVLKSYSWPGNIRQLENVIERAVVITEGPVITLHELPAELHASVASENEPGIVAAQPQFVRPFRLNGGPHVPRSERDRLEREHLVRALASADGNKAEAARALGIARSTLVSRLKKLGLS